MPSLTVSFQENIREIQLVNDALGYNEKLVDIYNKYKSNQSDSFAVVYQPANIDVGKFPIEALR